MKIYAVIDTNVLVSALLDKNNSSPTVQVVERIFDETIIPLYHKDILKEYKEVLHRSKFHFDSNSVDEFLQVFERLGMEVNPAPSGEIFPDIDDLIFYEIALDKQTDDAYLVTGNLKHYPKKKFVVTPKEMIEIIAETEK